MLENKIGKYERELDELRSYNFSPFEFYGEEFIKIGPIEFSSKDLSSDKGLSTTRKILDFLRIPYEKFSKGRYTTPNLLHKYTWFNNRDILEKDLPNKKDIRYNLMSRLKELISNQENSSFQVLNPQDSQIPQKVRSHNYLVNLIIDETAEINRLVNSSMKIVNNVLTNVDSCGCCITTKKINMDDLKSFDPDKKIKGLSRINYLADGISEDIKKRNLAKRIYERDVINPTLEVLEFDVSQLEKLNIYLNELEE